MKLPLVLASAVAMLGISSAAHANLVMDQVVGVKLLGGADIWTAPTDTDGFTGLGFLGSGAGFSYAGQGYYELRLIKFLSAEIGAGYDHGVMYRNVTLNQVIETRETLTVNTLRIPLLAKLNLPLPFARLWIGVGPDFAVPLSSSAKVEVTSGPGSVGQATYATRDKSSTYVTGGTGVVIELPLVGIEIPLELRASRNLSQPDAWGDRVSVGGTPTARAFTVQAQSSWDVRLAAGVGLHF